MTHETIIVVPCFNEAQRIDREAFGAFAAAHPDIGVLLVNDGSEDETLEVLNDMAARHPASIAVLDLPRNVGKAEAVRLGMFRAMQRRPRFVGFWDADLATPLDAVHPFIDLLRVDPRLHIVLGSRVRLLGRRIERRAMRHYVGRVFATAASLTLRLPVYDTQCGAKLFRSTPALSAVLSAPFLSRWVFDVEMIARFGALDGPYSPDVAQREIHEHPLMRWHDVRGSKLRSSDFVRAALDLLRIHRHYIRPRRRWHPASSAVAATVTVVEAPAHS